MSLSLIIVYLLVGFIALIGGAELLVRGASRLAAIMGIAPILIALTVVSFGTSSPEIAIVVLAGLRGQGDLGLGNVVGSNICNILLVLGSAALIMPLAVARQLVRYDVPIMIGTSVFALMLTLDGHVGRIDGMILLALGVFYIWWLVRMMRRGACEPNDEGLDEALTPEQRKRWPLYIVFCLAGLVLLVKGSDWLVKSCVELAQLAKLSPMVIGLTVVAVGTSLPELATSVVAAWRGKTDLAVGNVVGSNIWNLLFVLGIGALVSPAPILVERPTLLVDLPLVIFFSLACLPVFISGWKITRWEGGIFLFSYLTYVSYLIFLR